MEALLAADGSNAPKTKVAAALPTGDRCRLFLGNLPKVKTDEEIRAEVSRFTRGLVRVITYKNPEYPALHRGFCFLDYESASAASAAKRELAWYTVFGCKTIVDWADPEPEPDERFMADVRILFVRQYGGTLSERSLTRLFGRYGTVDRAKALKNYAFVHFADREQAQSAMDALHGTTVDGDWSGGVRLEVTWAKPAADKQTRERILRDRERRLQGYRSCGFGSILPAPTARPYSNYDHYEYDFGWPASRSDACSYGQQWRAESRQPSCPCAAATTDTPSLATTVTGSRVVEFVMPPQLREREDPSTAQRGHGDCVENSNVDDNVLQFFHRITNRGSKPEGE